MDPNSSHQQWSEWVFRILAPEHPPFLAALDGLRRATHLQFGSHGRIKARQTRLCYEVTIQAETSRDSMLDQAWVAKVRTSLMQAVRAIWVKGCEVQWNAPRLLAGNPEDGRPPSQWMDIPAIASDARLLGGSARPRAQTMGMPAIPSTAKVWGQ